MKVTTSRPSAAGMAAPPPAKAKRTPRVAVARAIDRDRPGRLWSLLLPPTFPAERK